MTKNRQPHNKARAAGEKADMSTNGAVYSYELGIGCREPARQRLNAAVLKRLDRAFGAAELLSDLLHRHFAHKAQTNDLALFVGQIVEHLVQLFVVELD